MIFRAIWPIVDPTASWGELVAAAQPEVTSLAAQAHARITGAGRFSVADSRHVPGSGRITPQVLMFEAPAAETDARCYRKAAS